MNSNATMDHANVTPPSPSPPFEPEPVPEPESEPASTNPHPSWLAPFAQPDFDPVAYAADIHHHQTDSAAITLTESRLAFAAQDISRQIDALVAENHPLLCATVAHFDSQSRHVSTVLQPQLDHLASQCILWRSSIQQPADALKSTLAQARASRDIDALARFVAHLAHLAAESLPDLPTHIADPECVSDTSIPALAATLADLATSLSLVDLSGLGVVDALLAPHIAGCRAALLARCNAMVHPKDLPRTKLALQGLATLGVLSEWHALRRAKVVGKLDNLVREWVEAGCNAEQKARGNNSSKTQQAVVQQFDSKVVDFLAAEAQFLHLLLFTHPLATASASASTSTSTAAAPDQWSAFWSAVASSVDKYLASSPQAHASAAITLAYPTLRASLGTLTARTPASVPVDLPRSSLAPLRTHYLARVQSLIQSSLTSLFQPSTHRPSMSSSLPPIPTCDAIHALLQSWSAYLPDASHLVATGINQLASALLSLCSDSILLVELFHDHAQAPTPAQHQVAHVARALLCVHATVEHMHVSPFSARLGGGGGQEEQGEGEQVKNTSERVLADAAQLVDVLLQAVIASIHSAMLDVHATPATAPGPSWTRQVESKLAITRALIDNLTPPSAAAGKGAPTVRAFVTYARLVLVGTLLQHVPALVALGTPSALVPAHSGRLALVDALAALEAGLAKVLGPDGQVHALASFRHLHALRVGVLAGEVGQGQGEDGDEGEAGDRGNKQAWARAARLSPIVIGTWRVLAGRPAHVNANMAAVVDLSKWTGVHVNKNKVDRQVVEWVLGWVERWDAAVRDGEEGKVRVWSEWQAVMDRVLGQGGWSRLVGEFGGGEGEGGR